MDNKEQLTVSEAGRRGGIATRERHGGSKYYRDIGSKGGQRTAKLYRILLKIFGAKGGRPKRPALDGTPGEGKINNKGGSGRHRTPPPGDPVENNISVP